MKEYPNLEGGLTMHRPLMKQRKPGEWPMFVGEWHPDTDPNTEPCPKSAPSKSEHEDHPETE